MNRPPPSRPLRPELIESECQPMTRGEWVAYSIMALPAAIGVVLVVGRLVCAVSAGSAP